MTQRTCGSVWLSSGIVLRPKFFNPCLLFNCLSLSICLGMGQPENNQKLRAPTRLRHFRKIRLIIQLIESWLLEFSLFLNLPMVFTGNRFYIFSLVESLHRQRIRKLSTTPRSYDPPVSLPHRPPTRFCQELGSTVNGAWSSY